jgi:hypothetical protein
MLSHIISSCSRLLRRTPPKLHSSCQLASAPTKACMPRLWICSLCRATVTTSIPPACHPVPGSCHASAQFPTEAILPQACRLALFDWRSAAIQLQRETEPNHNRAAGATQRRRLGYPAVRPCDPCANRIVTFRWRFEGCETSCQLLAVMLESSVARGSESCHGQNIPLQPAR